MHKHFRRQAESKKKHIQLVLRLLSGIFTHFGSREESTYHILWLLKGHLSTSLGSEREGPEECVLVPKRMVQQPGEHFGMHFSSQEDTLVQVWNQGGL